MTPADRAQLFGWRTLIDLADNLYYSAAQVAGLVALAERAAAEVARLEDGARADAAEIAGLRASIVERHPSTGERLHLALLPERPGPAA